MMLRPPLRPLALAVVIAGLSGCSQPPAASVAANPLAVRLTVPGGTEVVLILSTPVGSATSMVGDRVEGTTTSAILVGDRVAIPAGSTIQGHVTAVDPATKGPEISEKGGALELVFTEVTTPVGDSATMSSSLTSLASSKGETAGIGKIIGGHTKDAAIGTGIAAGSMGNDVLIPAGSALAITLDQPLTIAQRS